MVCRGEKGDTPEEERTDMQVFESFSEEETRALAWRLGRQARAGQVYALNGDLGTGKTVFTKGFAEGLGITEYVSSPTFTILQIYEDGRLPLYHFDVYRIEEPEEMEEVGFDEYVDGDGVSLIEWASRIEEILPPDTCFVTIEKDLSRGLDYRRITIE
jgi:tRNA threonylcarbamoyladenosine biosynthesis protein TsaE